MSSLLESRLPANIPSALAPEAVRDGRCPCCGQGTGRLYWTPHRVVVAIQEWVRKYGKPPTEREWQKSSPEHPAVNTLRSLFGGLNPAIRAAGFEPNAHPAYWTRERIVEAIQEWATRHGGKPPTANEWRRSAPEHPTSQHVVSRFGTWNNALETAGYWRRGAFGSVKRGREWVGPRGDESFVRRANKRKRALAESREPVAA